MNVEASRARKEEYERQRKENLENFYKIPQEERERIALERLQSLEAMARSGHESKRHEGAFETCTGEVTDKVMGDG